MEPTTAPSSAPAADPDPRNSLKHLLVTDPDSEQPSNASAEPQEQEQDQDQQEHQTPAKPSEPSASQATAEDQATPSADDKRDSSAKPDTEATPMYTSTTTTTRRNANGSVSSVYSGNKIRHLKKDDGIPLWRKDIQYDFLKMVFEDDKKVFHKMSDGTSGHTFADIYLDAMAKSSKCSKILKDKLLTERQAAVNMAMVCLLVNVGRMNTTLNFFPEMRAQLRTYHSIPSLQAHQDPNAYKQLQDAPRLKSILKGATEDTEQPSTIEDIKAHPIPRTNPVNLIFVLAQYAPKISELHFFPPRDFFDLVMRSSLSSRSRATAFLWLMWWYLESGFTAEDALNNPFGPGQPGTEGDITAGMPIKCPPFKYLTDEEMALENVDTEEEKEFGEQKREERKAILASDLMPVVTGPKRSAKKGFNNNPVFSVNDPESPITPGRDFNSPVPGSGRGGSRLKKHILATEYASDTDGTRTASPPRNMDINNLLNDETPSAAPAPVVRKGPGRGNWGSRRNQDGTPTSRSFKPKPDPGDGTPSHGLSLPSGPHGFYIPLNGEAPVHKRHRPQTQHQIAVEQYRRSRVDCILDSRLRNHYRVAKRHRCRDGAMARAWLRCKMMPDGYDTDEDMANRDISEEQQALAASMSGPDRPVDSLPGFVGLVPMPMEPLDYGEEAHARLQVMRRVGRRVQRWDEGAHPIKVRRNKRGQWREGQIPPEDKNGGMDIDGDTEMLLEASATPVAAASGRGKGKGKGRGKRAIKDDSLANDGDDMEGVLGEGQGGGDDIGVDEELDDADREMLGELDAEESEED